jgi:O-antigen ligase
MIATCPTPWPWQAVYRCLCPLVDHNQPRFLIPSVFRHISIPVERRQMAAASTMLITALLLGGASRADVLAPLAPAVVSVALLAWLVWSSPRGSLIYDRTAMIGWALLLALPLSQLIPLPWALWSALPGRETATAIDKLLGQMPWRPISLAPDHSLNALFALFPALAAFMLTAPIERDSQTKLLEITLFLSLAAALIGLAQIGGPGRLHFYAITNKDAGVGFFANANHQALSLCIAVAVSLWWLGERLRQHKSSKPLLLGLWAVMAVILLAGIAAARSRAGFGLLLPAMIGGCLLLPIDRNQISDPRIRIVVGLTLAFMAVAVLLILTGTIPFPAMTISLANEGRVAVLPQLLGMVADLLPFGSGLGTFDPVYRSYETVETLQFAYLNHAHNDYLEVAIEAGIPGIILVSLFLLWWLTRSVAIWRESGGSATRQRRLATIIIALCLLHSLVDYPLRTAALSVLFAMACAIMSGRPRTSRKMS